MPNYATSIAEDGTILDAAVASPKFAAEQGWRLIPSGSGAGIGWRFDGESLVAPPRPDPQPADVDAERDRRVRDGFRFAGHPIRLDEKSIARISAMGADARFALLNGAAEGDLRWADPDADFGWIAADNAVLPMDAATMAQMADAAKLWVSRHAMAARRMKDGGTIPSDHDSDAHWPQPEGAAA